MSGFGAFQHKDPFSRADKSFWGGWESGPTFSITATAAVWWLGSCGLRQMSPGTRRIAILHISRMGFLWALSCSVFKRGRWKHSSNFLLSFRFFSPFSLLFITQSGLKRDKWPQSNASVVCFRLELIQWCSQGHKVGLTAMGAELSDRSRQGARVCCYWANS